MLHIYFLQNWFNLSDPQAEDSLYVIESMCRFAASGCTLRYDFHRFIHFNVGSPNRLCRASLALRGSAYAMCARFEGANNIIDGARQELVHNVLKKSGLKLKFSRNANAATSRRDCCD
jgi:hypothetical protein